MENICVNKLTNSWSPQYNGVPKFWTSQIYKCQILAIKWYFQKWYILFLFNPCWSKVSIIGAVICIVD